MIDPLQLQHPAVRHLAWMCRAPQLYSGRLQFCPAAHLSAAAVASLQQWDRQPEQGPAVLTAVPHKRLGIYFEALYRCLLEDLLGWEVLASNLPVRSEGRTLGELDFLVRNPLSGALEHHEIAVKFYLGFRSDQQTLWYGPNAQDRLDIKTRRLLEHQTQLCERAETRAMLEERGISEKPLPRLFMPGYLFYPVAIDLAAPSGLPADHARGDWLYAPEALALDTSLWLPLHKPHWLGPWRQLDAPLADLSRSLLEKIAAGGRPQLFAQLQWDERSQLWCEARRCFVVPKCWPLG